LDISENNLGFEGKELGEFFKVFFTLYWHSLEEINWSGCGLNAYFCENIRDAISATFYGLDE
jgi:hypothetical protein